MDKKLDKNNTSYSPQSDSYSTEIGNEKKNLSYWCSLLKITKSQFFSMPEEELKLRINNLKGRLRLKLAKKLLSFQSEQLNAIENIDQTTPKQPFRLKAGERRKKRREVQIITSHNPPEDIGTHNVWDILYQIAENVDELFRVSQENNDLLVSNQSNDKYSEQFSDQSSIKTDKNSYFIHTNNEDPETYFKNSENYHDHKTRVKSYSVNQFLNQYYRNKSMNSVEPQFSLSAQMSDSNFFRQQTLPPRRRTAKSLSDFDETSYLNSAFNTRDTNPDLYTSVSKIIQHKSKNGEARMAYTPTQSNSIEPKNFGRDLSDNQNKTIPNTMKRNYPSSEDNNLDRKEFNDNLNYVYLRNRIINAKKLRQCQKE